MEDYPILKPNLSDRVKEYLYSYMHDQNLGKDMKLPAEAELSKKLGVSRVTVRRALDELEKEGFVIRIHGRGTFVNHEAMGIKVNLMPGEEFSKLLQSGGYASSYEIVRVSKIPAGRHTASALCLEEGSQIYEVEKLYRADGHPAIISVDRFSCDLIEEEALQCELKEKSMFEILRFYAGRVITRDKISIRTADEREMKKLCESRLDTGAALVFHGINYDQDNQPIIVDTEIYDTKYIKFETLRVKNVYAAE